MATRTSGKLSLVVVAVIAIVAIGGGTQLNDTLADVFSGILSADPVIISDGNVEIMAAADQEAKVKQCTPAAIIADRRCGDTKIIVFDASKMAFVTRNMSLGWAEGQPSILTKDRSRQVANRRAACPKSFARAYNGQCDEYPFASTRQGGSGARTEEVASRENGRQGGTLSRGYDLAGIGEGDDYLVVISNLKFIADKPYSGVDIALDQSCQA